MQIIIFYAFVKSFDVLKPELLKSYLSKINELHDFTKDSLSAIEPKNTNFSIDSILEKKKEELFYPELINVKVRKVKSRKRKPFEDISNNNQPKRNCLGINNNNITKNQTKTRQESLNSPVISKNKNLGNNLFITPNDKIQLNLRIKPFDDENYIEIKFPKKKNYRKSATEIAKENVKNVFYQIYKNYNNWKIAIVPSNIVFKKLDLGFEEKINIQNQQEFIIYGEKTNNTGEQANIFSDIPLIVNTHLENINTPLITHTKTNVKIFTILGDNDTVYYELYDKANFSSKITNLKFIYYSTTLYYLNINYLQDLIKKYYLTTENLLKNEICDNLSSFMLTIEKWVFRLKEKSINISDNLKLSNILKNTNDIVKNINCFGYLDKLFINDESDTIKYHNLHTIYKEYDTIKYTNIIKNIEEIECKLNLLETILDSSEKPPNICFAILNLILEIFSIKSLNAKNEILNLESNAKINRYLDIYNSKELELQYYDLIAYKQKFINVFSCTKKILKEKYKDDIEKTIKIIRVYINKLQQKMNRKLIYEQNVHKSELYFLNIDKYATERIDDLKDELEIHCNVINEIIVILNYLLWLNDVLVDK